MRASAEIACRNVSGNAYTLQAIFELAGVFCLLDYPREERETACSLAGKRLKPSQVVVLFLNG